MEIYLRKISDLVANYPLAKTAMFTGVIFLLFLVIKKFLNSSIDKRKENKTQKILMKRKVSQYLSYLFVPCVLILWFSQLQVFLVSIFAIAAAIVVALKELIMCVTGGILINVSNVFKISHRIEIDNTRGFVIEKNLLTTKVLEIGPEKNSQQTTGDIITIPNSLMLSKSLKNESYFKGYSIKSFVFKVSNEKRVLDLETKLKELAEEITERYLEDAKRNISRFCEKEGLVVPSVAPRTKVLLDDGKDFSVLVKLPILNSDIADVEQKLNRFFLDWRMNTKKSEV